jgi:hypothetical protein
MPLTMPPHRLGIYHPAASAAINVSSEFQQQMAYRNRRP